LWEGALFIAGSHDAHRNWISGSHYMYCPKSALRHNPHPGWSYLLSAFCFSFIVRHSLRTGFPSVLCHCHGYYRCTGCDPKNRPFLPVSMDDCTSARPTVSGTSASKPLLPEYGPPSALSNSSLASTYLVVGSWFVAGQRPFAISDVDSSVLLC